MSEEDRRYRASFISITTARGDGASDADKQRWETTNWALIQLHSQCGYLLQCIEQLERQVAELRTSQEGAP